MLRPRPRRTLFAVLCGLLAALPGCAGGGGEAFRPEEGPFLAPGPLPRPQPGTLRASPAVETPPGGRPGAAAAAGVAGMPAGLSASRGTAALPGAGMPGIGPVHALVVPVSVGPHLPLRDDAALARDLFGPGPGAAGPTLGEAMHEASGGLFRTSFEVLPTLVESRANLLPASPTSSALMAFAQAVLGSVAERTDLSRFDNDGPDGIPASRDDDGRLDAVILVVETEAGFPSVTLRQDFPVALPGGATLRSGAIHVLSLSRSEVADIRPALGLWLDGLGLDPGERFFPATFPRGISSLARARLGWLPVDPVLAAGTTGIEDGRAVLYPLQDVPSGAGFWLIERERQHLFLSRVARKADGHFFATEAHVVRPGEGQVLPLTRQFGERGPRVVVRWTEGGAPEAELVPVAIRPTDPVPLRRDGSR